MSEAAIRVDGLGKRYQLGRRGPYRTLRESIMGLFRWSNGRTTSDLWALKDVSFEVKPGEVVGVIGRNGAGKSTLLKILSRITDPTEGRAEVRGRVRALLEVGTGFHPELTGRENIYLNGAILGMKRAEIDRKFDEIVAFAEIEKFLDTPVKHYSSGMYMRLAFAVAAHLEPEILLIDEVLAVGDAAFQAKCLARLGAVAQQGRTVLFVSHNMSAVSRLCARCLWIDHGRIAVLGEPRKTVEQYLGTWCADEAEVSVPTDASKTIQFVKLRLTDAQDRPATVFPTDAPVRLHMTYVCSERIPPAYFAFYLETTEGVLVLFSDSRDIPESAPPLEAGVHSTWIEIPPNLLAPSKYYVTVGIASVAPQLSLDLKERACSFTLEDLRSSRTTRRPSILALGLRWNTE